MALTHNLSICLLDESVLHPDIGRTPLSAANVEQNYGPTSTCSEEN